MEKANLAARISTANEGIKTKSNFKSKSEKRSGGETGCSVVSGGGVNLERWRMGNEIWVCE